MEKGCKNHRETLYFSKGKIVYFVGKPFNIYRLRGKPYDNYRISPQAVNITGFPRNEWPLACISNKGEKLMLKHFCEKEDEKKLIIFCDFVALIRNTLHFVIFLHYLNITDYSCKKEILLSWISMGVFFPLCMVIDTKTCPFRNGLKSFLKVHYFFMHLVHNT